MQPMYYALVTLDGGKATQAQRLPPERVRITTIYQIHCGAR
jgi:hypothetical protein